jgi:hypothetical protein
MSMKENGKQMCTMAKESSATRYLMQSMKANMQMEREMVMVSSISVMVMSTKYVHAFTSFCLHC